MSNDLDILAMGIHPDDVELACSGTLLAAKAEGKKVGILDLTRGELGTRGSAETRDHEATAAAKLMGIEIRENLGFRDGFSVNDQTHQLALIAAIRKHRPKVILANAIRDRHPDHGKAAEIIRDSNFLAGLVKIETRDENGKIQDAHRAKVFHYIQDYWIDPDFVVDITDFMELKLQAIKAYKTQFYDPNSSEPATYISSKNFLDAIVARAREHGRSAGFDYAEGYVCERIHGVKSIMDIH